MRKSPNLTIFLLCFFVYASYSFANEKIEQPMRFSCYLSDYSSNSEYFIYANGTIQKDTPDKFLEFLRTVQAKPKIVYFNSLGGDLIAAIELGQIIRQHCLDTHVGNKYIAAKEGRFGASELKYEVLAGDVKCYSAAAYAFLGGNVRRINKDSHFGIHQFSGSIGEYKIGTSQILMTLLAKYLDEMGVDRRFLDIASLVPPGEIYLLTPKTVRSLNIDNYFQYYSKWELGVLDNGTVFAKIRQKKYYRNGWLMIDIRPKNNSFLAIITYNLKHCDNNDRNMEKAYYNNYNIKIETVDYDTIVSPKIIKKWHRIDKGTFRTEILLSKKHMISILQHQEIHFDSDFPSAYDSVSPSVYISTDGLKPAFLAMTKQMN